MLGSVENSFYVRKWWCKGTWVKWERLQFLLPSCHHWCFSKIGFSLSLLLLSWRSVVRNNAFQSAARLAFSCREREHAGGNALWRSNNKYKQAHSFRFWKKFQAVSRKLEKGHEELQNFRLLKFVLGVEQAWSVNELNGVLKFFFLNPRQQRQNQHQRQRSWWWHHCLSTHSKAATYPPPKNDDTMFCKEWYFAKNRSNITILTYLDSVGFGPGFGTARVWGLVSRIGKAPHHAKTHLPT